LVAAFAFRDRIEQRLLLSARPGIRDTLSRRQGMAGSRHSWAVHLECVVFLTILFFASRGNGADVISNSQYTSDSVPLAKTLHLKTLQLSGSGLTPSPEKIGAVGPPAAGAKASSTTDAKSAGKLHSLGFTPTPVKPPPAAVRVLAQFAPPKGALKAPPPSADNSAGLPPAGDQGAQGSCVSWASGYYYKTYQEGREHSWSLTDPAHQFSPAFLYNAQQIAPQADGTWLLLNTTFDFILGMMDERGCATLATSPYSASDDQTWPSAQAYREAIPYRAQSHEYLGGGETPYIFEAVKGLLASGDLCLVGFPIYRQGPYLPGRFDNLTAGDNLYDMPAVEDVYLAGGHALAIVGYDQAKFGGIGGYKVINSWGPAWGDQGFAWLSQRFLQTYASEFWRMTDRTGYVPSALVHWKVSHSYWAPDYDNVTVSVGAGPVSAPVWSKTMITQVFRSNAAIDMWYDVSEAGASLPPTLTNKWWLAVRDHCAEDQGTIQCFDMDISGVPVSGSTGLPISVIDAPSRLVTPADTWAYLPEGSAPSRNYYVNDAYTADDRYCTAAGRDTNDGCSTSTPVASVSTVLDRYQLLPGDTIWVDTGEYPLTTEISWCGQDHGAAGLPVRLVGSTHAIGTTFTRADSSGPCFKLYGPSYLSLENLRIKGGQRAIWAVGADNLVLDGVEASGSAAEGIYMMYMFGYLRRCLIYDTVGDCVLADLAGVDVRGSTLFSKTGTYCIRNATALWAGGNIYAYTSILGSQGTQGWTYADWFSSAQGDYNCGWVEGQAALATRS
jgi:hypothetical protein